MTHTQYWAEISDLAEQAGEALEDFSPPEELPAEERAMQFLREGVGPAVMVYVDARTGGEWTQFPPVEHSLLERAMNDYLSLYARCFGYEVDCQFTVREAAELVLATHNIKDAAQQLTKVPPREDMPPGWTAEATVEQGQGGHGSDG